MCWFAYIKTNGTVWLSISISRTFILVTFEWNSLRLSMWQTLLLYSIIWEFDIYLRKKQTVPVYSNSIRTLLNAFNISKYWLSCWNAFLKIAWVLCLVLLASIILVITLRNISFSMIIYKARVPVTGYQRIVYFWNCHDLFRNKFTIHHCGRLCTQNTSFIFQVHVI